MHDPYPQFGVTSQHIFEQQRVPHRAAEFWHAYIRTARTTGSHVNSHWDVQFLGERKVLIDRHVARRHSLVLETDLSHHLKTILSKTLSKLVDWRVGSIV